MLDKQIDRSTSAHCLLDISEPLISSKVQDYQKPNTGSESG